MLTELVLLLPLVLLYYYDIIKLRYVLLTILVLYWLPKPVIRTIIPSSVLIDNNQSNHIALTFDDVPYGYHEDILRKLDYYNQKATLFIISSEIDPTTEVSLIKAVQNGHQLANHGFTNSMHWLKSEKDLRFEIRKCHDKIVEIYQMANVSLPKHMFYWPGCGVFGPTILRVAKELNYTVTLGTVYPNDPIFIIPYLNYWYLRLHIAAGDVVILHDRLWTPSMLDNLLPWLESHNIRSLSLEQFITID